MVPSPLTGSRAVDRNTQPIWKPGDAIIVRSVRENARVGTVLPMTVVRDDDDLIALYLTPGTVCKRRVGKRGGPSGRVLIEDSGQHEDWTWIGNRRLLLWRSHEWFVVSLFWHDGDDTFLGWYVDILEPLRHTPVGFDTRDLILNVVIEPDRRWRWKDEDELVWCAENRLLAPYDAESIGRVAERAVNVLEAGDPLFTDEWIAWRPDPMWPISAAPEGWNVAQAV